MGKTPEFIIIKNRASGAWYAGHIGLGSDVWTAGKHLVLNDTAAVGTNANILWGSGTVDEKVFSVGGWDTVNRSGNKYIAYCWTGVEGFSNFGKYEANGNANGPFVYLGFKPALVIIKNMDGGSTNWMIWDNKRGPFNSNSTILRGNATDAENTGTWYIDMVSNGFKIRTGGSDMINNNQTHVYMAWAEMPFKYATAK